VSQQGCPGAKQLMKIKVRLAFVLPCLKCNLPFKSWDRKKNRLCGRCLLANHLLEERTDGKYLYAEATK